VLSVPEPGVRGNPPAQHATRSDARGADVYAASARERRQVLVAQEFYAASGDLCSTFANSGLELATSPFGLHGTCPESLCFNGATHELELNFKQLDTRTP